MAKGEVSSGGCDVVDPKEPITRPFFDIPMLISDQKLKHEILADAPEGQVP
jgi:hypothetical protein